MEEGDVTLRRKSDKKLVRPIGRVPLSESTRKFRPDARNL